MAQNAPELVFVAGPQDGERVVVKSAVVIVGRTAEADVHIKEEHVSREQFRLSLTADGWVLENLSANGTWINEQKYKSAKKQILLDTGDVISIGAATRILYIAPGDNIEEALIHFRAGQISSQPVPPQAKAQATAAQQTPSPAAKAPKTAPLKVEPVTPEEQQKAKSNESKTAAAIKGAKLRKYAIFGAIYAMAIIGLWLMLKNLRNESTPPPTLAHLTDEQIKDVIVERVNIDVKNDHRAKLELDQAKVFYDRKDFGPANLYLAVKHFKLYEGYSHSGFEVIKDYDLYQNAMDELIKKVTQIYSDAWKLEQAGGYKSSAKMYEDLIKMLTEDKAESTPGIAKLRQNIVEHLSFVREQAKVRR